MVTNGAKEVIMAVAEINLEEFPEAKCGQVEYDQALYSVNERLNTFKDSHWPFDSGPCVPLKVLKHFIREVHDGELQSAHLLVDCTGVLRTPCRWRRLDSTTPGASPPLTPCAAWSASTNWMAGRRATAHWRSTGGTAPPAPS